MNMNQEYDNDIIHIHSSDYKQIQQYFFDLYISCKEYKKMNPTKEKSIDCSRYYRNFLYYSGKTHVET